MQKQQSSQEHANQQPEGIEMGDQGASYGSSYNETTPGQTEANRRESLDEQGENEQPTSSDNDQSSR